MNTRLYQYFLLVDYSWEIYREMSKFIVKSSICSALSLECTHAHYIGRSITNLTYVHNIMVLAIGHQPKCFIISFILIIDDFSDLKYYLNHYLQDTSLYFTETNYFFFLFFFYQLLLYWEGI